MGTVPHRSRFESGRKSNISIPVMRANPNHEFILLGTTGTINITELWNGSGFWAGLKFDLSDPEWSIAKI